MPPLTEDAPSGWMRRLALAGAGVAAAGSLTAVGATAWVGSQVITHPNTQRRRHRLRVADTRDGWVALRGDGAAEPGWWRLTTPDGGGPLVAPTAHVTPHAVWRRVVGDQPTPPPGARARLAEHVFTAPEQAGLTSWEVEVPGAEGATIPVWWLGPPRGDLAAVFAHGWRTTRRQGLRLARELARLGVPTVIPAYHHDPDATGAGACRLGASEWADLHSACNVAVAFGARRLLLVGYSMGASTVAALLRHTDVGERVAGVLLDSPALDWSEAVRSVVRRHRGPAALAAPVVATTKLRARLDWQELRYQHRLGVPLQLVHSPRDTVSPIGPTRDLAAATGASLTEVDAVHCCAWNVAPRAYRRMLTGLLSRAA